MPAAITVNVETMSGTFPESRCHRHEERPSAPRGWWVWLRLND
jgi:hypothetical protein